MQKFSIEFLTQYCVPRIPVEHDGNKAVAEDKLTIRNQKTHREMTTLERESENITEGS